MNDERWKLVCEFMLEVLAALPPDADFPSGTQQARETLSNKIVLAITDPFMEPWTALRLEERNAIRRANGQREASSFGCEVGGFPSPYWRP